jgi:site-specific recombinase XerD
MFGRTAIDPFTDTHLRRRAHTAWKKTGLERIGFHECRHSYRSFLNAAGIDPTRADWYLGHANHTASGRYQHALPGQLASDAETLDAYPRGRRRREGRSAANWRAFWARTWPTPAQPRGM